MGIILHCVRDSDSFFFFKQKFNFICAESSLLHRFFSSCGKQASHCGDLSCGAWGPGTQASVVVALGLSSSVACRISWTRDQIRVPCIDRQILIYCITREVPDSFLLLHCVRPWPSWQPPKPRPWGRGRFWTLSLSTNLDLITWLLLSAWEPEERGLPSRLQIKSGVWEEWEQILRTASSLCHIFMVLGGGDGTGVVSVVYSISLP